MVSSECPKVKTKTDNEEKLRAPRDVWQQDGQTIKTEGQIRMEKQHNEEFVNYYRHQKIVDARDWEVFYSTLKTELPSTFRIVEGTVHTEYVTSVVRKAQSELGDMIRPLDWYPGKAYEVNVSRKALRSMDKLRNFHQFLVNQSEAGTIFRQEAVSMVPALFIPIQPNSRVLDMCAAPGSKTSQLVEFLHRAAGSNVPTGVVVANDSNSKRGHMLIHHLRHLDSPTLVVSNHYAQLFPNVFIPNESEGNRSVDVSVYPLLSRLKYSSVLCDVPCSGDGTMRKAKVMWKDWQPERSLGLHRLQLNILRRGLELLEIGGTIVYSTCSFNPLENEAVVNAALRSCQGAVEVVDTSNQLPSLPRASGITKWDVYYKGNWLTNINEAPQKGKGLKQVTATMFPQYKVETVDGEDSIAKTSENIFHDKEVPVEASLELKKCLRFLPHLSNTGGFFVAVLRKKTEIRWVQGNDPRLVNKNGPTVKKIKKDPDTEEKAVDEGDRNINCIETGKHSEEEDENMDIREEENMDIREEENNMDIREEENRSEAITFEKTLFSDQCDFVSLRNLNESERGIEEFWTSLGGCYGFTAPTLNYEQYFVKFETMKSPKRVWFASTEAARIANAKFRTPLKFSPACSFTVTMGGRRSDHYRLSCSGAYWLSLDTKTPLHTLKSNQIAIVDRSTLLFLLGTNDTTTEEEKNEGDSEQARYRHRHENILSNKEELQKLLPERPCLFICELPPKYEYYAVSGWSGKTNVQLLVDKGTRYALRCLLESNVGSK